ncbi:MAG: baseplate J/gp47 family protein [Anaerolineales bacterium]|nr:MAG: baseplate J/gp47 family protein [Anaerolineales bacterium]
MKTKIITLESHDDLISVRDRMSWAKTPRILLVVPKFEKVALRQADFKVLQRHASTLGAQVGVVTRVRRIRADAEELGIPVFESTGEAQKAVWAQIPQERLTRRPPAKNLRAKREQVQVREEAWRARPATRLSAFIVGVLSVFAIVALFLPRAQIRLQPVTEKQSIVLPVTASASTEIVFVTGDIPAREKRIILDGSQTVIVTGEGVVPQSKASGVVVFRNLTQQSETIPVGALVSAGGVQFATTKEGEIEGGVGKEIELPIEAVEGGLAGNVEAETIDAIEGRLGLSLSVTNPEPTSGGRERSSLQASDADRARAKDLLMKFLDDEARAEFLNENESGDVLFDETISVSQILLEEFDPPAGAAGTTLTLTMQVEYSALYASASDLLQLASLALNASLPSGFRAASDAVSIESGGAPSLSEDGSARWQIRAEREIVQSIDPAQVMALIRGMSVDKAQSFLNKSFEWKDKPVVTMFPSWWKWIPLVPFRIEVVTK